MYLDLNGESVPIRPELSSALEQAWQRLTEPGTWFNGAQRYAIAAEARHAEQCALCAERKSALSPYAISGDHDSLGQLPGNAIEAIHRLRTDAGRITERWVNQITGDATNQSDALSEEAYVEIIGIISVLTALDTFDDALGRARRELPAAGDGEPSCQRPPGAVKDLAWVSTLSPEAAEGFEPNPYPVHGKANIHRGLSLVPQEVFNFFDLDVELYVHDTQIRDFSVETRAISRAQVELIAGRASSINNCLY